jgi:hypothetical protein
MALHLDPDGQLDPDREERLRATAAHIELRPADRIAHLATRSLACPACGMPIAIAEPVGFSERIACAFCEGAAPTREFVRDRGWPQVDVIARL